MKGRDLRVGVVEKRNEEIRDVIGGKVMQSLMCNQEDLYFVCYRKAIEGNKNRAGVGPSASSR